MSILCFDILSTSIFEVIIKSFSRINIQELFFRSQHPYLNPDKFNPLWKYDTQPLHQHLHQVFVLIRYRGNGNRVNENTILVYFLSLCTISLFQCYLKSFICNLCFWVHLWISFVTRTPKTSANCTFFIVHASASF